MNRLVFYFKLFSIPELYRLTKSLEILKEEGRLFKYNLAPPRNLEFPSYVLILISKRHFQENPIFLQINKELLIESSKAAVRLAFEFFLFSGYVVEAVKRIARSN